MMHIFIKEKIYRLYLHLEEEMRYRGSLCDKGRCLILQGYVTSEMSCLIVVIKTVLAEGDSLLRENISRSSLREKFKVKSVVPPSVNRYGGSTLCNVAWWKCILLREKPEEKTLDPPSAMRHDGSHVCHSMRLILCYYGELC